MKAALDRKEADVFAFIPPGDTSEPQWQPNPRNWAGDAIALQHLIQRKTSPDRDMAPSNGEHAPERRPA